MCTVSVENITTLQKMCLKITLSNIKATVLIIFQLVHFYLWQWILCLVGPVLVANHVHNYYFFFIINDFTNDQAFGEFRECFSMCFSLTLHMNISENIYFILVQKKNKIFIRLQNFFDEFLLCGNTLLYKLPVIITTPFTEMFFKSNFLFNTLGNYSGKWLITSVDIKYCTANHHAILHAVIH